MGKFLQLLKLNQSVSCTSMVMSCIETASSLLGVRGFFVIVFESFHISRDTLKAL